LSFAHATAASQEPPLPFDPLALLAALGVERND